MPHSVGLNYTLHAIVYMETKNPRSGQWKGDNPVIGRLIQYIRRIQWHPSWLLVNVVERVRNKKQKKKNNKK